MSLTVLLQRHENAMLMAAIVIYLAAMLLLWAQLFFRPDDASRRSELWHASAAKWGRVALGIGAALHLCSLIGQGDGLFAVREGVVGLFGWFLAVTYLLVARSSGRATLGAFVAPVVFAATLYSLTVPGLHNAAPGQIVMPLLILHVGIILVAYVSLAVAFASALLYLLQEGLLKRKKLSGLWQRLPPLQVADELIYRATSFGLAMLSLGIVISVFMQKRNPGYSLLSDPTGIFTLAVWLTFALYMVARLRLGWRGRRTNMVVICGFVLLVASFFGAPHVLHSVTR